jgi:perosamine synthetase
MMKIAVNEPDLRGNEKKYLDECIDTGWISSEGPFVEKFEREMARLCARNQGIAVSNGSVALDAALQSLGLPKGSEVIMPAFTIISCASAILRAGCVPVLADCDRTWNMDMEQVESKITQNTSAIMAVHIYGLPADMARVRQLARKYNLKVIEDAAEAIGQICREYPCGAWGDVSCFSFYPNKHVTTGEGGMILCDDDELAERCRSLRNLCFIPGRRFVHESLGYNFRMSNLQAALGVAQLEKLGETVRKKRYMGAKYQEMLGGLAGLELPVRGTEYADNIYWVFGIVLGDGIPIDAGEFMKRLAVLGVGTRPFFWPMHEQPVLLDRGLFVGERYPESERIARRGFYIPSGVALTDGQMEYAASQVASVLGNI